MPDPNPVDPSPAPAKVNPLVGKDPTSSFIGYGLAAAVEILQLFESTFGSLGLSAKTVLILHFVAGALVIAGRFVNIFNRGAALLLVAGSLLLASPAFAQEAPPPSKFGGCVRNGTICFAPSLAITLLAINASKGTIEAGFTPGACYGGTLNAGKWSSIGVDACFALQAAPIQNASGTFMFTFLNGFGRVGASKGFIGDHDWRIPLSFGTTF